MLATESSTPPKAQKAKATKLNTPASYMRVVLWMLSYCMRHPLRYEATLTAIFNEVARSSNRAWGPALRLAQAVWCFRTRCLHLRDETVIVEEENAFARLYHSHQDGSKGNYHVWKAMELFIPLRKKVFGPPLMTTVELPPVDTPHPVRHAIRLMEKQVLALRSPSNKNPVVVAAAEAIANANPTKEGPVVALAEATRAYAQWLAYKSRYTFTEFEQKANAALHQQHIHHFYLEEFAPELDAAITNFRAALYNPFDPSIDTLAPAI